MFLPTLKKSLAVTLMTFTFSSTACELHAGMDSIGFGFQHPLMQQHMSPKREAIIGLRIDRKREMAKDEQAAVPLRFTVPPNYEKVNVDVTTSSGLSLLSDERFKINKAMGKQDISFVALEPGTHEVVLKVYALKSNVPVTYTRKIKVVVS